MTVERVTRGWSGVLEPAAAIARTVADTEFVPRALRGNVPAVTACILYGDEIGVSPMAALQGIHVIDGRPFVGAETMRALVFGAGHSIQVTESTGTRCHVTGRRATGETASVEWTIEMARAAGLAGKGAWRTYPRALLLARASAELCRVLFPDVVRGLAHVPDDAPEIVADWADVANATGLPDDPAPAPVRQLQWTPPVGPSKPETDGPAGVPWADDPPTPPEPVETPPEAAPERAVSRENVRRIMAAYGDLGYGDDRTTRLALFSALLGFPVESTKTLPAMAALRLYGSLNKLRDGTLIAIADENGGFDIRAGVEPEPEDDEP